VPIVRGTAVFSYVVGSSIPMTLRVSGTVITLTLPGGVNVVYPAMATGLTYTHVGIRDADQGDRFEHFTVTTP
jgi:hypothetical protein